MQLQYRMFLFLMMLLIIGMGIFSFAEAMEAVSEEAVICPRAIATKIRECFGQHGVVMTPRSKEGSPPHEDLRALSMIRPRAEEYWRAIKSDILRGDGTTWLTSLKKYDVLNDAEISEVTGPYTSFCVTLKGEDFFGKFDRARGCNPREFVFKSQEFLKRFLGEGSDTLLSGGMYFFLAFQELLDFQQAKANHMKKKFTQVYETFSSEDTLSWIYKQSYLIYWKWDTQCFLDDKTRRSSPKFSNLPEKVQSLFGDQRGLSNGYTFDQDMRAFLGRTAQILGMRDFLENCRQTAYQLGFNQQSTFLKDLERIVRQKTLRFEKMMHTFVQIKNMSTRLSLKDFNQMVDEVMEDLRGLKTHFDEKAPLKSLASMPGTTYSSFSVSVFDGVLRSEVSSFDLENVQLYYEALRDFYFWGWPFLEIDFAAGAPLPMDKYALLIQAGKKVSQNDDFEKEISFLREQLQQSKRETTSSSEKLTRFEDSFRQKEKRFEDRIRNLEDELSRKTTLLTSLESLKDFGDKENIFLRLKAAQEEVESLKGKLDQSAKDLRKSLKDEEERLKGQFEKEKRELEQKIESERGLKLQLQESKAQSQRDSESSYAALKKKQESELATLRTKMDTLTQEKSRENLQITARLQDCMRLLRKESVEAYSWELLLDDIRGLLRAKEQKGQEKDLLESRLKVIEGERQREQLDHQKLERLFKEQEQKWNTDKERMTTEFQDRLDLLESKIRAGEENLRLATERATQIEEKERADKERMTTEFQGRLDELQREIRGGDEKLRLETERAYRSQAYARESEVTYQQRIRDLEAELLSYTQHVQELEAEILHLRQQLMSPVMVSFIPQLSPAFMPPFTQQLPVTQPHYHGAYHGRGRGGTRGHPHITGSS